MLTKQKRGQTPFTRKKGSVPLFTILAAVGMWQLGAGSWIHIKAQLAQLLMHWAWVQTLAEDAYVRPWPWADTWPVGRLRVRSVALDVIVLHGHSGRSLAFAPGLAPGSSPPGTPGTTVISAHRDTHFSALAQLEVGAVIDLQSTTGRWLYRVVGTEVIDVRVQQIVNNPLRNELVLVTCYPFDALTPGGPLRYLVYAALYGTPDTRSVPSIDVEPHSDNI